MQNVAQTMQASMCLLLTQMFSARVCNIRCTTFHTLCPNFLCSVVLPIARTCLIRPCNAAWSHDRTPCDGLHVLQPGSCHTWRPLTWSTCWLHLTREQAQIAFTLDRDDATQGMVCMGTGTLTGRLLLSGRILLFML